MSSGPTLVVVASSAFRKSSITQIGFITSCPNFIRSPSVFDGSVSPGEHGVHITFPLCHGLGETTCLKWVAMEHLVMGAISHVRHMMLMSAAEYPSSFSARNSRSLSDSETSPISSLFLVFRSIISLLAINSGRGM